MALIIGHKKNLDENHYLRAYQLTYDNSGNKQVTWRNIDINTSRNTRINLFNSCLAFDDYDSVLLSDFNNNAVHVFSSKGHYQQQLLSYPAILKPSRIVINKEYRVLYVGQQRGEVKMFKLA